MSEAINRLSHEVNNAVNENLSGVQDYVNVTLQVFHYALHGIAFNLD